MSCLACGMGMPRVKRLHHHRPHHGTHVPVAGAPGKVPGWWNSNSRERKALIAHGDWRTWGSAAVCTGHRLLGDWRTGGSAAVCTRFFEAQRFP